MTEHTPGPWHGQASGSKREIVADHEVIAEVWQNRGPNARLIAAAPTMYEYVALRAANGDSEAAAIVEGINGNT